MIELGEGRLRVKLRLNSLEEVEKWVLSMGGHGTVVRPEALRARLGCARMFTALASGMLLGFSAGLSPGPMLTLVLAQTLRHGSREGCKIALTPLLLFREGFKHLAVI